MAAQSARFEDAHPAAIMAYAVERFGPRLVVASSLQDAVLVHLAVTADPEIKVVFLDTGAHFPETLAFVEQLRAHYGLNLTVARPPESAEAHPCGTAHCCQYRKVAPLVAALRGADAWVSGVKRVDAPSRAATPILGIDTAATGGAGPRVKVNPLATWTDGDVGVYVKVHGLPVHPLTTQGYPSIGCAPVTTPVAPGGSGRDGRWAASDRTECGLHA